MTSNQGSFRVQADIYFVKFLRTAALSFAAVGMVSIRVIAIILGLIVWLYFLPYIVARRRSTSHTGGLYILNICFGWAIVPWVAMLIWACAAESSVIKLPEAR